MKRQQTLVFVLKFSSHGGSAIVGPFFFAGDAWILKFRKDGLGKITGATPKS